MLERKASTQIIWNSSAWVICLLSPIYLFITYITMDLFYTLIDNPILLPFICCSNCSSFAHWELFRLAPVSFINSIILHFFFFSSFLPSTLPPFLPVSASLLSDTTSCSKLIFCIPWRHALVFSVTFLQILCPFLIVLKLETQILQ